MKDTFSYSAVVLDVAVFVFITLVDRPITEWLYPFIFYVQVLDYTVSNPILHKCLPSLLRLVLLYRATFLRVLRHLVFM